LTFFRTWALGIFVGVLIGTSVVPFASTEILQAIFAAFMVTVGVYEGFFKDRVVIAKAAPRGGVKLAVAAAIGWLAAMTGTGGAPWRDRSCKLSACACRARSRSPRRRGW
jgi:uncharacterized membrane protein YfcA